MHRCHHSRRGPQSPPNSGDSGGSKHHSGGRTDGNRRDGAGQRDTAGAQPGQRVTTHASSQTQASSPPPTAQAQAPRPHASPPTTHPTPGKRRQTADPADRQAQPTSTPTPAPSHHRYRRTRQPPPQPDQQEMDVRHPPAPGRADDTAAPPCTGCDPRQHATSSGEPGEHSNRPQSQRIPLCGTRFHNLFTERKAALGVGADHAALKNSAVTIASNADTSTTSTNETDTTCAVDYRSDRRHRCC
jgi:hypothetical protein